MLKETLKAFQKVEGSLNHEENTQIAVRLFREFLYLMVDSQRFPNKNINLLTEFVFNLIADEHFSLISYKEQELYDHMVLFVDKEGIKETACLYIPQNFINEVALTPERQIGVIASIMSQCRDYFCGQFDGYNFDSMNKEVIEDRAFACQAEALLTLIKIAEQEKMSLDLSDFQIDLLNEYPNGLADLDKGLWYSNPEYKSTFSPPKHNPSLN